MQVPSFVVRESISSYGVLPDNGFFGRPRIPLVWDNCREVFHVYADGAKIIPGLRNRYYFISHYPQNTMDLIGYIEDQRGIKNKTRFHLHANWSCGWQTYNVLQIEPAGFWLVQQMRHQFFTCCLRASLKSYGWDHLRTLRRYPYFRDTWKAVEGFLDGYTWCINRAADQTGWFRTFKDGVGRKLRKPINKDVEIRAYELWEMDGRHNCSDNRYWDQAKEEVMPC